MNKRMPNKRERNPRRKRSVIHYASEGKITEVEYIGILSRSLDSVYFDDVVCGRNPSNLLSRMKAKQEDIEEKNGDVFWIICDKDEFNDDILSQINRWSEERNSNKFLFTNPRFEWWLLLHFVESVHGEKNLEKQLKNHIPNYDKHIPSRAITLTHIRQAVDRSKKYAHSFREVLQNTGTTIGCVLEDLLDGVR